MMCEHEWITTRAVYRTITPGGYKNHEINRRVCIYCLKTRDEVLLEQQLAAANAQLTEAQATIDTHNEMIERMKCCGNCNYYLTVCGVGKCFEKTKGEIYRYDPTVPDVSGDSECEKWEAAG